jgi:hypothetical protein
MPSAAAQVLVTVIPIVGIVTGGVLLILYLLLSYKRTRLIIDAGHYKRTEFDLDTFSLLSGLLLFSIGSSLTVFFIIKEGFSYAALGGLIPLSLGIGLILFYVIRLTKHKG